MSIDLAFDHVSKAYRIPPEAHEVPQGLLARIRHQYFQPPNQFWAVEDLSFEVLRGQALGIIGHNGAGKSTILKLLSGITAPSRGVITTSGRLAALLEVGSGFHQELTGRENIFLSGSILGMSRKEIHKKLDNIIDFAEIRPFIDVPVKRYSSGMYVRLGFSIAAHLEPDILLLDEVLAVGDATFQKKSKQRILELKKASTTIIFISHDLHAVEQVCDRVLVVKKGRLIHDGTPQSAITAYEKSGRIQIAGADQAATGKLASITSVDLLDANGRAPKTISTGCPLRVRMKYVLHAPLTGARLRVILHTPDYQMHCSFSTGKESAFDLPEGPGGIEFSCDALALQPGLYMLDPAIEVSDNPEPIAWIPECVVLPVAPGPVTVEGTFHHPHTWRFLTADAGSSLSETSHAR
jgi:lipopolysaccharide transport system ATP-binding protein